jgi:hypothetical protein
MTKRDGNVSHHLHMPGFSSRHSSAAPFFESFSSILAKLLCAWALLSVVACRSDVTLQRDDPVLETVAAEVAGDIANVHVRLLAFFNDGSAEGAMNRFAPDDRLHRFEAVPARAPPALQRVQAPSDHSLAASAGRDPALQRYLVLASGQREHDLYLFQPTGPHYWPSEYRLDGSVLPFSTDFILHLRAVGVGRTRVEIIEVLPRVRLGRKWGFAKHGVGPSRVDDVRAVAPSTRDRVELLARLVEALQLR